MTSSNFASMNSFTTINAIEFAVNEFELHDSVRINDRNCMTTFNCDVLNTNKITTNEKYKKYFIVCFLSTPTKFRNIRI